MNEYLSSICHYFSLDQTVNYLNRYSSRLNVTFNPIFQRRLTSAAAIQRFQEKKLEPLPSKTFHCSVIPTLHCADTQEWRKRLILAARHNIIISGNYCGGKAFDDLLELIDKQMEAIKELRVIIIGHPQFIQDDLTKGYLNKKNLDNLYKKKPERFYFVESPDTYQNERKLINHTKFTVIDFGKCFILGGSGIKDNFVLTGLDDLTVEQYLASEKALYGCTEEETDDQSDVLKTDHENFSKDEEKSSPIPGNFRDMDFVFRSEGSDSEAGKKIYRQALYLAYKWDRYKKSNPHSLPIESWDLAEVSSIKYPALRDLDSRQPKIHKGECVLYRMLKQQIPDLDQIKTKVTHFEESIRKVTNVQLQLFFPGRENKHASSFTREMVETIRCAKKYIFIDHMYFQPPKNLESELIKAVKRRVRLTIITAGVTKEDCPNSEKKFGPKNAIRYKEILKRLEKSEKSLVEVFEFEQCKKGLHKKVVIVDDQLFGGSSNLDSKGLTSMGDHEMNFKAKSQRLVELTLEIIAVDIKHSRTVWPSENIPHQKAYSHL